MTILVFVTCTRMFVTGLPHSRSLAMCQSERELRRAPGLEARLSRSHTRERVFLFQMAHSEEYTRLSKKIDEFHVLLANIRQVNFMGTFDVNNQSS